MRYILSFLAVLTLGLGGLTACQNSAAPLKIEASKTTGNSTAAPPAEQAKAKVDEHGHVDDAPRITLADAKTAFDAGQAVFIDTRAADAYKLERIKGALNITTGDSAERYKEIPKDKKIIVYCS